MRIKWLIEKKHYTDEKINKYGWSFWQLKYSVSFIKKKGAKKTRWDGEKVVIYKASIQTNFDQYDNDGKLELMIFKDVKKIYKEEIKIPLERKLADLNFDW